MSFVELSDKSIVILIFPPGTGGNHLANLLSLHEKFQKRVEVDNYLNYLIDRYKFGGEQNVHVGPLENLNYKYWVNGSKIILSNSKIPILCAHVSEYSNYLQDDERSKLFLKNFTHKHIILFSFPSKDSIGYERFYPYRHGESVKIELTDENKFPIEIYKNFYTILGFKNKLLQNNKINDLMLLKENYNIVEFKTENYIQKNGYEYVTNFFKSTFDLLMPNFGKILHELWYDRIYQQLPYPKEFTKQVSSEVAE